MNPSLRRFSLISGGSLILASLLATTPRPALAASHAPGATSLQSASSVSSEDASAVSSSSAGSDADVTIEAVSKTTADERPSRKEVPWLGLSTDEVSEALASQLDLPPGVGLVVTYVAPDSPASKAGLRKNDLLVRFDDQSLVHPAQLRKLVRVRKEGDSVKLAFYRGGKQQTVSATLGLKAVDTGLWDEEGRALKGNLKDLEKELRDLHIDETLRDQMKVLRDSLGNIKIDQKEIQQDIRRGMDEARKAVQDALRHATNADSTLAPVRKVLENLARSVVVVDDKANVVVRSADHNVKSVVQSDDSGTLVLVGNPKLHLTAHDKDGKLLFDGPIETSAERSEVPKELWDRVEPLLDQMRPNVEQPESKESK